MEQRIYDMIILGGGPGGYTAALYAARAGLDTLVLEKLSAGGQMALSHKIDNYPGFPEGIDGFELGEKMQQQAELFGAQTEYAQVLSVDFTGNPKILHTDAGDFYGHTVVIATGADPKKLGLPNEDALVGKGVAYCAACDGRIYKGKAVAVIGGGNSAAADASLLSRIAEKVYIIHRRDSLRADKASSAALYKADNVEFIWNSTVEEFLQADKLTGLRLKNVHSGEESTLPVDGVFISIGRDPVTGFLADALALDSSGYIPAGENTATNIPGVYAVGDVRTKQLRQIVTAVADGAMAVHEAEKYLANQ